MARIPTASLDTASDVDIPTKNMPAYRHKPMIMGSDSRMQTPSPHDAWL